MGREAQKFGKAAFLLNFSRLTESSSFSGPEKGPRRYLPGEGRGDMCPVTDPPPWGVTFRVTKGIFTMVPCSPEK